MSWAEILDRSAVEILVDHGGADVRAARNSRRIAELLADAPHHGRNDALRLALGVRGTALGQRDRGDQRAAPGAEVLRRELVSEMVADVVVQPRARQVAETAFPLVTKEARTAGQLQQLRDGVGELLVDERRAHDRAVLRAEVKRDPVAAYAHVPLSQRR